MNYIFILLVLAFAACKQPLKPVENKPKNNTVKHIDTSKYAILKFDPNKDKYVFDRNNKPADLSANEIAKIETLIAQQVARYNKSEKATTDSIKKANGRKGHGDENVYNDTITDPGKYYKQLIAVTDAKGQKEVWVGCFCNKGFGSQDWRKSLIMVYGGGACFFQLRINLTTNRTISFSVNAPK